MIAEESLAFMGSMIAASLGGILAFVLLYRRKWRLWLAALVLLGAAWVALYVLSSGQNEEWALTFILTAMFGIMPLIVGWVFGGVFGALRGRKA